MSVKLCVQKHKRGADDMSEHVYNLVKQHHSVRNFKKERISLLIFCLPRFPMI